MLKPPKTRRGVLAALAALAVFMSAGAVATAQDSPDCKADAARHYQDASPDLSVVLDKLDPKARDGVLGWINCDAPHRNLGRIHEEAVRALDASTKTGESMRLFVSASQSVEVKEPRGSWPRSELVPKVKGVAAAQRYLDKSLQPPAGAEGWTAVLADLSAETHGLEAWASLARAKGLKADTTPNPRDEVATAMLVAAAYLSHAQDAHPPMFTALAASPESVDAFKLMWTRAEAALKASEGLGLGHRDAEILKAAYGHLPALQELFRMSGRTAPAFVYADAATKPADAPKADVKADDAKAGDAEAEDPKDAKDLKDGAKDAQAGAASEASWDSPLNIARMVIGGLLLLLPWILVGVVALLKRRRSPSYVPLTNRLLALATLALTLEMLGLMALSVISTVSHVYRLDGLFLLAPLYVFVVLVVMLRKVDTEGELRARHLLRVWGKWGSIAAGVLLVTNVIMLFFFPPIAIFAMPITAGIVAIMASVFMVQLWRSGAAPDGGDAGEAEAPVEHMLGDDAPEPEPAAAPPAPVAKKAKPEPKPEAKPAAKPAPEDDLGDLGGDGAGDEGGLGELSDDDFAAMLAASEAAPSAAPGAKPSAPAASAKATPKDGREMSDADLEAEFEALLKGG